MQADRITTSVEHWLAAWKALGAAETHELRNLHVQLQAAYGAAHRHYHTAQHLQECFARLSEHRALAERLAEVEIALWFHDAIYDVKRSENESRSADWAHATALAAGVTAASAERIHALIMFTRHAVEPIGRDAQLLVDVDLSILGADPARFDEYERQVREEYDWVPGFAFRQNRRRILQEFLARPAIFSTEPFIALYEERARANLQRSLAAL